MHLRRTSKLMTHMAVLACLGSVELPAKQVNSELMARGIDDICGIIGGVQSTVISDERHRSSDLIARWNGGRDICGPSYSR